MTPIWSQVMKDSGLSLDELTLAIRDVWYVSRLFDNILKGMGSAMTADDAARRDQSGMNVIHASGTMLLFLWIVRYRHEEDRGAHTTGVNEKTKPSIEGSKPRTK